MLLFHIAGGLGHGALVYPPSRNAVDRFLPAFTGGKSPKQSDSCNCGDRFKGCDAGLRAASGGQPCLWFSQGCSIGCQTCTGIGSHSNVSLCNSTVEPTLPKHAWTMNLWAEPGSMDDSYRYNPWRKPGSAPVFDACGKAGGTEPTHAGPGVAVFANNQFAKFGDLGSQVLPAAPSGTVWTAGSTAEVAWGIRYNHGGGYQYRLCPASETLTEECFQRTPLPFVRDKQQLMWNNGTRMSIVGVFVDVGTTPAGSTWARNPIPRIDFDDHSSGQPASFQGRCKTSPHWASGTACRQFDPPCPQDEGWFPQPPRKWGSGGAVDVEGVCSGDWTGGVIVDVVRIPVDVAPGDYVLGWRWDCEESTQVWASCADVTIAPRLL